MYCVEFREREESVLLLGGGVVLGMGGSLASRWGRGLVCWGSGCVFHGRGGITGLYVGLQPGAGDTLALGRIG